MAQPVDRIASQFNGNIVKTNYSTCWLAQRKSYLRGNATVISKISHKARFIDSVGGRSSIVNLTGITILIGSYLFNDSYIMFQGKPTGITDVNGGKTSVGSVGRASSLLFFQINATELTISLTPNVG
jgi:hypothetical protein